MYGFGFNSPAGSGPPPAPIARGGCVRGTAKINPSNLSRTQIFFIFAHEVLVEMNLLTKLTAEQQEALHARGVWANEACDACGKLLGAVRWTKRGEPGEWCSKLCRDGESSSQRGQTKGGRPRKHKSAAQRQKSYRERLSLGSVTKPVLRPA